MRAAMAGVPQVGDFVRVRTRRWLVEGERAISPSLTALRLACLDDNAQGETVDVVWHAELDCEVLRDEGWSALARDGTDRPETFAAYLRTLGGTPRPRRGFQALLRLGIGLAQ